MQIPKIGDIYKTEHLVVKVDLKNKIFWYQGTKRLKKPLEVDKRKSIYKATFHDFNKQLK